MRKTSMILGLVAVLLFASANEAFGQRLRIGRGFGGLSIGAGRGYYSPYYYRGWGGYPYYSSGYGYSPYYGRGYGYYGNSWWPSYSYGYYSSPSYYSTPSYYYSTPSHYYSSPSYSYSNPVVQVPTTQQQSFYNDPGAAAITVRVPDPNAEVWFDGIATQQRGIERTFSTPGLQQAGTYTIRARWMESGRTIDQQRSVRVQPGQSLTVDFRANP